MRAALRVQARSASVPALRLETLVFLIRGAAFGLQLLGAGQLGRPRGRVVVLLEHAYARGREHGEERVERLTVIDDDLAAITFGNAPGHHAAEVALVFDEQRAEDLLE